MAYRLLVMHPMKRFATCALLAFALALNAEAKDKDKSDKPRVEKVRKDKEKDKPPVIIVPALPKGKDNGGGPVYSVPDTGSTALLLGTALVVLGIASRRFSVR
jgi:VPDSG-CTERM motif